MDSPRLDRKILLQRFTSTQHAGTGEEVKVWNDLASVWASKRDVSDSERVASAEVSAAITTRFQIRWDSSWASLNAKDRVVYDDRIYGIVGVKELGRREGLEISAIARADLYIADDEPPGDGPLLDFSLASNSQFIGQVV